MRAQDGQRGAQLPADLEPDEKQADGDDPGGAQVHPGERGAVEAGEQIQQIGGHDRAGAEPTEDEIHRRPHVPEGLGLADQRIGRIAHRLVAGIRLGEVPARHRRRLVEIFDLGIGAEFRMHLEMAVFLHQPGDVAAGVVEVAELDRTGDARRGAGRGRVRVHPRRQAGGDAVIDPVDTEGALLGDAEPFVVGDRLFLKRLLSEIELLVVNDGPRLVGAGDGAGCAADAQIVVHGDQPVGPLLGGAGRAHGHAGRLGAVLAADHHEHPLHIGEGAGFHVQNPPPLNAGDRIVGMLAGDGAGLTADAAIDVDHHAPPALGHIRIDLVHAIRPFLRSPPPQPSPFEGEGVLGTGVAATFPLPWRERDRVRGKKIGPIDMECAVASFMPPPAWARRPW